MAKEIVVQHHWEETVIAVFDDGVLIELYNERADGKRLCGSIFKGVVKDVLPGMQAAFVDIGLEKNAFLYVDDAIDAHYDQDIVPNISHLVKSGQEILVQVTKEANSLKGVRVSRRLSLAGRYAVLMIDDPHIGVSRKITDEIKREELLHLAEKISADSPHGIIIRTIAKNVEAEQIATDLAKLQEDWTQLERKSHKITAPALVYHDFSVINCIVRDLLEQDVSRIVVNDYQVYEELREFFRENNVNYPLRLLEDDQLKAQYNLTAEIERALKRRVWLKNGGFLVIDQTEAMTVIDVNTGKFVGKNNLQETIVQMNCEAAIEIARQLQLRSIGGIIIVDFIDMQREADKALILAKLDEALKKGKVKSTIQGLTQLGLVEITRKKTRSPLSGIYEQECPYCHGKGRLLSEETLVLKIVANLREIAERSEAATIAVSCHPQIASELIGENGQSLTVLEQRLGKRIIVTGNSQLSWQEYKIQAVHQMAAEAELKLPVESGEILRIKVQDVHQIQEQDGIGRIGGYVIRIEHGAAYLEQEVLVEIEKVFATYAKAKIIS